jgi:hypothetical protein
MSKGPSVPMEWSQFVDAISTLDSTLNYVVDPDDVLLKQEAIQQIVMGLAQAYHLAFSGDPQHPQFMSFLNPVIKSAAPNPDYMYRMAIIEDGGVYRVSGHRGTTLFVQLGVGSGLIGWDDVPGPPLASIELDDDLTVAQDGTFSVIISPERPTGYTGDWIELKAGAHTISLREASYNWLEERDGIQTIERLDGPATYRRWSAAEITEKMERLAGFPERYAKLFSQFVKNLSAHPVNTVVMNDWAAIGGLAQQVYYEGLFELDNDEALILETEIPETSKYWSVLLADQIFNTIEWEKCQSSLNGYQAQLDSDGKFRAVISLQDPGVPNWLDPAGRTKGVIQGRWYKASSAPKPQVKRVKFSDLRAHLPGDTPVISTDERKERLLARFRGAQTRRKW